VCVLTVVQRAAAQHSVHTPHAATTLQNTYVTTAVVLVKHGGLPEDGSVMNRNMSEQVTDF
jgi:hypothetical protein